MWTHPRTHFGPTPGPIWTHSQIQEFLAALSQYKTKNTILNSTYEVLSKIEEECDDYEKCSSILIRPEIPDSTLQEQNIDVTMYRKYMSAKKKLLQTLRPKKTAWHYENHPALQRGYL